MDSVLWGVAIGGVIGFVTSLSGHWFIASSQREAAVVSDERRLRDQRAARLRDVYADLVRAVNLYNAYAVDFAMGQGDSHYLEDADTKANDAITLLSLEANGDETIARLEEITGHLRRYRQNFDLMTDEDEDAGQRSEARANQRDEWDKLHKKVSDLVKDLRTELVKLEQPI